MNGRYPPHRQAFRTSTTKFVLPVVHIDDSVIADGEPGPLGRESRARYEHYMLAPAGPGGTGGR